MAALFYIPISNAQSFQFLHILTNICYFLVFWGDTSHSNGYEVGIPLWVFWVFLINLFLAVLGLRCCTQAFSSCGEQGLLFIAVRGLLIAVDSLVAEHGL